MRLLLFIPALLLLTRCGGAVTDYSPDTGSPSSLQGNQGGSGVQTSIWSDDPGKKTLTNQKPQ